MSVAARLYLETFGCSNSTASQRGAGGAWRLPCLLSCAHQLILSRPNSMHCSFLCVFQKGSHLLTTYLEITKYFQEYGLITASRIKA